MSKSLFLQTLAGEQSCRVPLWFMRQAGRYLPEYQELRAKYSMLEAIRTPELAATITLQPLKRFPLDAAIIFADILNPLIGMGLNLDFIDSVGPVISNPPRCRSDVEALAIPSPQENVDYTLKAISLVRHELQEKDVALIGFSGAPFTLAYYAFEGKGGKGGHLCKRAMYSSDDVWSLLMEKLTTLVGEYLIAQAEAGAQALQIFDSWLGLLAPQPFTLKVLPWLDRLVKHVRSRVHVPIIFFAPYAIHLLPYYKVLHSSGITAFGVDWKSSLRTTSEVVGSGIPLQGNFDPDLLFSPHEIVDEELERVILDGAGVAHWCFNAGHGILPGTPIVSIERVIDRVRSIRR
jgi:uroporphyrinogen decarboxylase